MSCTNEQLSDAQKEMMDRIVELGRSFGMTESEIELAVQVAFQESSLGQNITNPNSSAYGLFQYTNGTWSDRHGHLDRTNNDHQISAYFSDLVALRGRYNEGINSGQIPSDITFNEYAYIRHHDGWYYTNFDDAPGSDIFGDFSDFCIPPSTPSPGGGGGGGGGGSDSGGGWSPPPYWDDGEDDDDGPTVIIEVGDPVEVPEAPTYITSQHPDWM